MQGKGREKRKEKPQTLRFSVNIVLILIMCILTGTGLEWKTKNFQKWTGVALKVNKLLNYKVGIWRNMLYVLSVKKETEDSSDISIRFLKFKLIMNLFLLGSIQSFHWFHWILDSGFKCPVSRKFCHFSQ